MTVNNIATQSNGDFHIKNMGKYDEQFKAWAIPDCSSQKVTLRTAHLNR
jgi:hypothetical protein